MFSGQRQQQQEALLEPRDVDVYLFRQRLAKITVDGKCRSNEHSREAHGYKWLFFLCGLLPGALLSCIISVLAAGWDFQEELDGWIHPNSTQHNATLTPEQQALLKCVIDTRVRDTAIMVLGILNAVVVAMGGYWNWQGTAARHACAATSFEHLHTKAQQMMIRWEQQPSVCTPDYEALNRMYADLGRIYEEAPILGFRASRAVAYSVEREIDIHLRNIDREERTEGGVARCRKVPPPMATISPRTLGKLALQDLTPLKRNLSDQVPNEEMVGLRLPVPQVGNFHAAAQV